jgi:hypothetical protein
VPFWAERLFEELSAAPCKGNAQQILDSCDEVLAALDERTRKQMLAQAQDIIAELPD